MGGQTRTRCTHGGALSGAGPRRPALTLCTFTFRPRGPGGRLCFRAAPQAAQPDATPLIRGRAGMLRPGGGAQKNLSVGLWYRHISVCMCMCVVCVCTVGGLEHKVPFSEVWPCAKAQMRGCGPLGPPGAPPCLPTHSPNPVQGRGCPRNGGDVT